MRVPKDFIDIVAAAADEEYIYRFINEYRSKETNSNRTLEFYVYLMRRPSASDRNYVFDSTKRALRQTWKSLATRIECDVKFSSKKLNEFDEFLQYSFVFCFCFPKFNSFVICHFAYYFITFNLCLHID